MTDGDDSIICLLRAQWTFSFDRKNRLKTHTYAGGSNVRGNIWYDGAGRVWQRWNDNSVTGDWDDTLMRYVYDGNSLAQEHQFLASGNGMWIYNYVRYDRDYLHKPDGVRQRSYVGPSSYTDEFLFRDMADIASKVVRGSSVSVTRAPRMASGERQPENDLEPTTSSFTDISRLGAHGAFTESYGGGTTNPRTQGFDALLLTGTRHSLGGLARHTSRRGNNPYQLDWPTGSAEWSGFVGTRGDLPDPWHNNDTSWLTDPTVPWQETTGPPSFGFFGVLCCCFQEGIKKTAYQQVPGGGIYWEDYPRFAMSGHRIQFYCGCDQVRYRYEEWFPKESCPCEFRNPTCWHYAKRRKYFMGTGCKPGVDWMGSLPTFAAKDPFHQDNNPDALAFDTWANQNCWPSIEKLLSEEMADCPPCDSIIKQMIEEAIIEYFYHVWIQAGWPGQMFPW